MTIPTLHGPGELLATLPAILGFTPVESVVIVGIRDGGEIGALMRVDREDCLLPEVLEPMSRSIAGHLTRDRAVAAILVSYTAAPVRVSCEAADALRCAVGEVVSRIDTWAVADGRYFAPGCADVTCCPIEGTAVPESDVVLSEGLGPDGLMRASADHLSPRRLWGAAPALERRRCARAADRWQSKRSGGEDQWRRDSVELWQRHLARGLDQGAGLSEAQMGRLVAGMTDVRVRDAVIVWLVPGSHAAIEDVLAGEPSPAVARALDSVLDPLQGLALDAEQAAALRSVIGACVSHSRRKEAAPLMTVLALVEWWMGNSGAALSLCDAALTSAHGYRLADLIRATICAGIMPGWRA